MREALLDNFNTPEALVLLQRLVNAANAYINCNASSHPKGPLVQDLASYVFYMLKVILFETQSVTVLRSELSDASVWYRCGFHPKVFGVCNGSEENLDYTSGSGSNTAAAAAEPLVQLLGEFREGVRKLIWV